jgi:hypothetical protein
MSIEIRQLSIKSNILQQTPGSGNQVDGRKSELRDSCGSQGMAEETRNEILAECKSLLLDLLSRNRER